ncbi:XRE family transcriptional regulator [Streptomyces sp. JJ36]|uniref:XRE family transcriptional regulator n=1 Tax=Streptomyces sp. JJ36 TaxID=2736645 RepID=UPI001F3E13F3|nr:XRE family transcriptional regulator [Streptomyces sp. JJ36]MCF6524960.1 XRE family transcriptional regulator [Streptomyces sp. JJ36]
MQQPYDPATTSFDAAAARRLREALGMTPAHVAHGMWAAYGLRVAPATVASWELGEAEPGEAELPALAGALWCAPADLLGTPSSLRQYRLARGMAVSDLALLVGMQPEEYVQMERDGEWRGDDRQAAALGGALELPPDVLLELTGRADRLAELLRSAVTTRWQAYTGPVADLVAFPRRRLETVLRALHADYRSAAAGSLNWGGAGSSATAQAAAEEFLAGIVDRFWARAR